MRNNKNINTWRYDSFSVVAFLFLMVLILRLVQIQIGMGGFDVDIDDYYKYKMILPPERGKILDRNLKLLAFNIPSVSVVAYPKQITDIKKTAMHLAPILGLSRAALLDKLDPDDEFVTLARKMPLKIKAEIDTLGIPGVNCEIVLIRKYPKKRVGCQLIGFTDIDGNGISGFEKYFDFSLRGTPGEIVYQKTASNEIVRKAGYRQELPEDGQDFVLTMDYKYQYIAETELHKTILHTDAQGGVVVIMNPKTGEILAMASEPGFDPNEANKYIAESWRPKAITDSFEPGSTFKTVVMSAVLNENIHISKDIIFCENGEFELKDVLIHDTMPYSWLTLREIMVMSSNIGMAKLAMEIDKNILYEYTKAFGFGNKYDIEIVGERRGILKHPRDWSGVTPAFMAMGHEVTANSIQMCNMYCAIANGGYLLRPTIVKQIRKDGKILKVTSPKIIRQVISKTTADTLKSMLADAVNRGTGKKAQIKNIQVCGKTGTAQMPYTDRHRSGYQPFNYLASFCGFFPKNDPKICIFVMVEKPRRGYYGGAISAPCFQNISERIIEYEGIDYFQKNDQNFDQKMAFKDPQIVPNLIGCSRTAIHYIAQNEEWQLRTVGDGETVLSQTPLPGTVLDKTKGIQIEANLDIVIQDYVIVPDVRGLPVRNALNVLATKGIRVVLEGSGTVIKQQPDPGQKISKQEQVLLRCETSINLKDLLVLN